MKLKFLCGLILFYATNVHSQNDIFQDANEKESHNKTKFYHMSLSKASLMKLDLTQINGMLFSVNHRNRFIPKDQVRLSAFAYKKSAGPMDTVQLIEIDKFETFKGSKQFTSYAISTKNLEKLKQGYASNADAVHFLFIPMLYPDDNDYIMYDIVAADKDFRPLVGAMEVQSVIDFELNPSPPARPGLEQ